MKTIKELLNGEKVNMNLLILNIETRETKNGSTYYNLVLSDKTGKIPAKIWDSNKAPQLNEGDVISIVAEVGEYNDALQLTIKPEQVSINTEIDKMSFFEHSNYGTDGMWNNLTKTLDENVKETWCRALVKSFIADEDFVTRFKMSSAATMVHHAVVSGLLEHTLFVVQRCCNEAKITSWLNKDLLVTCAFLHDIGKLDEISMFPDNKFTTYGHLIGHVAGSALTINQHIDKIEGFPDEIRFKILHCILAHHGKMENGSPKTPAIPEAWVLSAIDDMDAKLNVFKKALEAGDWKEYNKYLNGRVGSGQFLIDEEVADETATEESINETAGTEDMSVFETA